MYPDHQQFVTESEDDFDSSPSTDEPESLAEKALVETFNDWQRLPLNDIDEAISNLLENIATVDPTTKENAPLLYQKAIMYILTNEPDTTSTVSTCLSSSITKILRNLHELDRLHEIELNISEPIHPFIKKLDIPQFKNLIELDGGYIGRRTIGKLEVMTNIYLLNTNNKLPIKGGIKENDRLQREEAELERIGLITSRLAKTIFTTNSRA